MGPLSTRNNTCRCKTEPVHVDSGAGVVRGRIRGVVVVIAVAGGCARAGAVAGAERLMPVKPRWSTLSRVRPQRHL
jgi:hypothetical protein